ncbi:MAG: hypothetical protein L0338_05110 [Acidobacteria bacterium]|nr:hypothetical protein [Acidobacteriota bacterium]
MLGILGYGGALPGVVYPMLLLVVLKSRPNLGAPIDRAAMGGWNPNPQRVTCTAKKQ